MPAKGGGRRATQREQGAGNLREVVLSVAMSRVHRAAGWKGGLADHG
jgi:hypothetical protein